MPRLTTQRHLTHAVVRYDEDGGKFHLSGTPEQLSHAIGAGHLDARFFRRGGGYGKITIEVFGPSTSAELDDTDLED